MRDGFSAPGAGVSQEQWDSIFPQKEKTNQGESEEDRAHRWAEQIVKELGIPHLMEDIVKDEVGK